MITPVSPAIWYAATAVPPRPPMTSPTTADGDTSSNPEPKPSATITSRKPTKECVTASSAMLAPPTRQPASMIGLRPIRSASVPPGNNTNALTATTMPRPIPVQMKPRSNENLTNSGISDARSPSTVHWSAKFVVNAARKAGNRRAAFTLICSPAALANVPSGSRSMVSATAPAAASVPAYTKNGSRIETCATRPPSVGAAVPTSRPPTVNRPPAAPPPHAGGQRADCGALGDPGRRAARPVEHRVTMRTLGRLGALVGLAIPVGLVSTVAAPGAVAADSPSTPKVVQSNWYWYHQ